MTNFLRIVKFAFLNFWRNIWLSLVTISIITLSFLSINFFILANALIDTSMKAIEDKVSITVQFKKDAPDEVVMTVKDKITNLPETASVEYITKEQALEVMKEKYEKEGNITVSDSLKELDTNPLFASIIVKARNIESYPAIMNTLNTGEFDSSIERKNFDDRKTLIQKIGVVKDRIKQVGLVINLFFIIITALIVFNTVRIAIYTRKEEVGIMKLVGAANWFVRTPLLLESSIYSVISITLTVLILYPILGIVQPFADKIFDGQAFDVLGFFSDHFLTIFGYQLLASIALNMISCSLAIGKYLRV